MTREDKDRMAKVLALELKQAVAEIETLRVQLDAAHKSLDGYVAEVAGLNARIVEMKVKAVHFVTGELKDWWACVGCSALTEVLESNPYPTMRPSSFNHAEGCVFSHNADTARKGFPPT